MNNKKYKIIYTIKYIFKTEFNRRIDEDIQSYKFEKEKDILDETIQDRIDFNNFIEKVKIETENYMKENQLVLKNINCFQETYILNNEGVYQITNQNPFLIHDYFVKK